MTRVMAAASVMALAACGGGEENKAKSRADALQPGQYEVTADVTSFRSADEGAPKIETPQGTRTARSVCVTNGASPPPDLFADEGISCTPSGNPYLRGGTINLNLDCERAGLSGDLAYSVSGTFDAQSFEVQRQLATRFASDGDVVVGSTVRGRRTGECAAAPAQANAAAPAAGR